MSYHKNWMLFFKVQSNPLVKKICSILAIFFITDLRAKQFVWARKGYLEKNTVFTVFPQALKVIATEQQQPQLRLNEESTQGALFPAWKSSILLYQPQVGSRSNLSTDKSTLKYVVDVTVIESSDSAAIHTAGCTRDSSGVLVLKGICCEILSECHLDSIWAK